MAVDVGEFGPHVPIDLEPDRPQYSGCWKLHPEPLSVWNTCSFDQNPAISVSSSGNNTVTVTLKPNNDKLVFTTSVQGPCNVVNTGDPNFTAVMNVTATALLRFDGSKVSVQSANASITRFTLSGNNLQAKRSSAWAMFWA